MSSSSSPAHRWLLLFAGAARAWGQVASPTALPPVDVPLPAQEETASSLTVREPSGAVSVVELEGRRAEAKDVAEQVGEVPGALVQDVGGAGQKKTLSLRGSAPDAVLVLLDGMPLAGPGEAVDLSVVPLAALERLEVLRGAGSRYGPGGMGGVVNLVTRAAQGGSEARLFGQLSQGSFLTTTASIGGATPLGPGEALVLLHGLDTRGDFTYRFDDKPQLDGNPLEVRQRANNQALEGGGLARYHLASGSTSLDLLAEGSAGARGLAGPVENPSPDAKERRRRGSLSARAATRFASGGTLSVLGFARLDSLDLEGGMFGSLPQLASAAGVEAVYTHLLGRHGLTVLASGGGDWLTQGGQPIAAQGRVGAMVGDELLLFDGKLGVDGAVRVDLAGAFWVLSPKLGAHLELPLGFSLRGTVGLASRPPSFFELYVTQGTLLPNPKLRPERGLSSDLTLGLKRGPFSLEATGFFGLYQDLISYEYYPPSLAKPFNFLAAAVGGAELVGRAQPTSWLDASAAYTYLLTANLKDDPRYYLKALPFRPAHRVAARLVAGVPALSLRGEVAYQSAESMNRTQTLAIPGRALISLGVSSTPVKVPAVTVTVTLEVKNLLDVQTQDVDGYPLPPRAAYLTLGLAWDGAKK